MSAAGLAPGAGCHRDTLLLCCSIFRLYCCMIVLRDCLGGHRFQRNKYMSEKGNLSAGSSSPAHEQRAAVLQRAQRQRRAVVSHLGLGDPQEVQVAACYFQDFPRLHGKRVFTRREAAGSDLSTLSSGLSWNGLASVA